MEHNEIKLHELEEIIGGLGDRVLASEEESRLAVLHSAYDKALADLRVGLADQLAVDSAYDEMMAYVDELKEKRI